MHMLIRCFFNNFLQSVEVHGVTVLGGRPMQCYKDTLHSSDVQLQVTAGDMLAENLFTMAQHI